MPLHGFLVLDARSGTVLYSERFTKAYGLEACEELGKRPACFASAAMVL